MARRRVRERVFADDGVLPVELLDVDDPVWSSFEAAKAWADARGLQMRGRLCPWYLPAHFHRCGVEQRAKRQSWVVTGGQLDLERLNAAGVPIPTIEPESWSFPPEVKVSL